MYSCTLSVAVEISSRNNQLCSVIFLLLVSELHKELIESRKTESNKDLIIIMSDLHYFLDGPSLKFCHNWVFP